jgi:hypothetical protein
MKEFLRFFVEEFTMLHILCTVIGFRCDSGALEIPGLITKEVIPKKSIHPRWMI